MLLIALRAVAANPFRYLATAVAIVLGVAFFTATSVVTGSFEDTLNSAIEDAVGDVDAAVRSTATIEIAGFELRQQIPPSVADDVADLDGVEATFVYKAGYAQVLGKGGERIGSASSAALNLGFLWIDDAEFNTFEMVDGRPPLAANEVVLDLGTFEDGEFAIGDSVRVVPLPPEVRFTIVGVMEEKEDGIVSGQALAFDEAGATLLFGTLDVDQIFVEAEEGLDPEALVESLNAQLGSDLEAVTGEELVDEFQELVGRFIDIIRIALQVFAGVALFVGAFVIYNTFAITVKQRSREMALLRAIGAARRQVLGSVVTESVLLGIVASILGALAGIGVGWVLLELLNAWIGDFNIAFSLRTGELGSAVAAGTVITVAAAFLPAVRGSGVAPIEALREAAVEPSRASRVRNLAGLGLLGAGVAIAVSQSTVAGVATGLVMVVLSIVFLGPVLVRPLSRLLAAPMVRFGSFQAEMARENASRNPKRTSTTSLTLMIGVALVVTATLFAAALSHAVRGELEDRLLADYVISVDDELALVGGFDSTIVEQVAELPGVEAAVAGRGTAAEIFDEFALVTGLDTSGTSEVFDLSVLAGRIDDLGPMEIAVHERHAKEEELQIGSEVVVRFLQRETTLTVAGIYNVDDTFQIVGEWLVDNSAIEASVGRSLDTSIYVKASEPSARLLAALDAVLDDDPTANLDTKGEFIDAQANRVDDLLILLYGLLGMSVIVALIGIVNTMALSIFERTRELGLLRAVGMTSAQLNRTVLYETVIIALLGTAIGLVLGGFIGNVVTTKSGNAFTGFPIPWGTLLVIMAIGSLAGLLAGVLPARRASKLDVLEAIATE